MGAEIRIYSIGDSWMLLPGGQQLGSAGSGGKALDNAILLGSKIDGTLDTIVLCARPIAGSTNVDIEAALTWRELL